MHDQPKLDQRLIDLYDDFTHRHLDRRLFLGRASALVGTAAAAAAFAALKSNYAHAEQVKADDPRLSNARVTYPGSKGPMTGYLSRPKGDAKLPGIVVIHQNRGLNPHIEDVARRLALAEYVALAPDLLSSLGGTPADDEAAAKLFEKLDKNVALADALKTKDYLRTRSDVTPKIGIVGFCFGGGIVNMVAVSAPDLAAAVAYYGVAPPLDLVPNIKAPLLLHYAGLDARVDATWPGYEAALKKSGVRYEAYVYEGANHAFNDDTTARYDPKAAALAWQRTLDFFQRTLKA